MPDIELDNRTLDICATCPGRVFGAPEVPVLIFGSSWQEGDDVQEPPYMERREVATETAHLGTIAIVNHEDTPSDGVLMMDCVVEAVGECKSKGYRRPVERAGLRYCPGLIDAGFLFYERTNRGK